MIRVQNIYYMLAYAYEYLRNTGIRTLCDSEKFRDSAELLAAILECGISNIVRRGIYKTYIGKTEAVSSLKGKTDITESVKRLTMLKQRMVCSFDEFSADNYFNRILKTTVALLLRSSDIGNGRKRSLSRLLPFFGDVQLLDPYHIVWDQTYYRNNEYYRAVLYVCRLITDGLLQTTDGNAARSEKFFDDKTIHYLYQKFILGYYRKNYPELRVYAKQIRWQLDDKGDDLLPEMQSDITVSDGNRTLIIDAKYYNKVTAVNYGKRIHISSNLYQIFTYVKNFDVGGSGNVSGMLLYALPDDRERLNSVYKMHGNRISVKTIDLSLPFADISEQLDRIMADEFGESAAHCCRAHAFS